MPLRRLTLLSAAWLLLVGSSYWPAWYAAQLWRANHAPRADEGMRMQMLTIWVTPGWPAIVGFLILLLTPPLALWGRWADLRRRNTNAGTEADQVARSHPQGFASGSQSPEAP